jgi:hypothetical protein
MLKEDIITEKVLPSMGTQEVYAMRKEFKTSIKWLISHGISRP